jgi:hypothetical protein
MYHVLNSLSTMASNRATLTKAAHPSRAITHVHIAFVVGIRDQIMARPSK